MRNSIAKRQYPLAQPSKARKMTSVDQAIVDTCARLFTDHCPPSVVNETENGTWPAQLWRVVEDTGLTLAWIPEEHAGAGASLADGFAIARTAAEYAVPLPLAETLLGGWLLTQADLSSPQGPMAIAPLTHQSSFRLDDNGAVSGTASRIPFASSAVHIAAVVDDDSGSHEHVALLRAADCDVNPGRSLAGEPQDQIEAGHVEPIRIGPIEHGGLERMIQMGAVMRSQQMAGAMTRVLQQCIQYARDREQFGRPIGRFQAVQHNIAMLAAETAAAGSAADAAVKAIDRYGLDDPRTKIAVASGKIRSGEAAGNGAAIAHQVHGAMGYTHEYSLHQSTRRLWAWRDDFGPESLWAGRLGRQVTAAGDSELWPALADI